MVSWFGRDSLGDCVQCLRCIIVIGTNAAKQEYAQAKMKKKTKSILVLVGSGLVSFYNHPLRPLKHQNRESKHFSRGVPLGRSFLKAREGVNTHSPSCSSQFWPRLLLLLCILRYMWEKNVQCSKYKLSRSRGTLAVIHPDAREQYRRLATGGEEGG